MRKFLIICGALLCCILICFCVALIINPSLFHSTVEQPIDTEDPEEPAGPTVLEGFTFDGNILVSYAGTATDIVIPSSYSIRAEDGAFIEGDDYQVTSFASGSTTSGPFYEVRESLESVIIPEGFTRVDGYCFYNCTALTSVLVPNSIISIGSFAFSRCSNLTSVDLNNCNQLTSIGRDAFFMCSSLASINIPSSVKTIDDEAFYTCNSLVSVVIPSSVTEIGDNAFYSCSSLMSIEVDSANINYSSIDGVLFDKEQTLLICYPAGKTASTYIVPNTVSIIGAYSFYGVTSLKNITILENVNKICDYAFFSISNFVLTIEASIPFTIGNNVINSNSLISVPEDSVESYQTAWIRYADRIYPNIEMGISMVG